MYHLTIGVNIDPFAKDHNQFAVDNYSESFDDLTEALQAFYEQVKQAGHGSKVTLWDQAWSKDYVDIIIGELTSDGIGFMATGIAGSLEEYTRDQMIERLEASPNIKTVYNPGDSVISHLSWGKIIIDRVDYTDRYYVAEDRTAVSFDKCQLCERGK